MKSILKLMSVLGLALNIVPAILAFNGVIGFKTYEWLMLLGTILWFSTAPFWINKGKDNAF